jgi:hypothetical protein
MPSVDPPRVPLAGASPLSRRGRCAWWRPPRWREGARGIASPGSMGRASSSEGQVDRETHKALPEIRMLPSSSPMLEHPLSPSPGESPVWRPRPCACAGQGCLHFRSPAKGSGCRATRVLGSLRKYVNERGIAPAARPTDLRSRGLPARASVANPTDQRLFCPPVHAPTLTGEARHLWLGRCPRESFP